MKLLIFLAASPKGLTGGAADGGNAAAAALARAPAQRLLGRPSPLHVGGRSSAGLGRAGRRARSPHTRTAAARRGSWRPGEGVLFGIQRTRTAAAAAVRTAPAATSPPSSHPWVKGIFPL